MRIFIQSLSQTPSRAGTPKPAGRKPGIFYYILGHIVFFFFFLIGSDEHQPSFLSPTSSPPVAAPLNIKEAEGVHLLTKEEQELCSSLRIMPRPYLVIKETILKECARLGGLKRRQARELIKIDVNKTSRIYDFFVEVGWIRPPKGGEEGGIGGAAATVAGVGVTAGVQAAGVTATVAQVEGGVAG